jgi:CubicO group peptidase (beta-lactamase class C family)
VARDVAAWGDELRRTSPLPGGVVAITGATEPPAVAAFGSADLRAGTPMRPDHWFQIGSISKAFTSLLVHQQIDAGRLTVDTPITELLPWLEVADGRAGQLTVARLLTHTSGLPIGADPVPDELEQAWILRRLVTAEAGHFHYSNLGYVLLGLGLRALTGRTVSGLLAEQVLDPLGMADSRGAILDADRDRYAVGHQPALSGTPWVPGDPLEPAVWFEQSTTDGNVGATAADLSRLAVLLLGRGLVDGRRIVSEEALDRMTDDPAPAGEPVLTAPGLEPSTSSRYGHGLNIEEVGGHRVLSHGGGMVGYSTFFLTDLDAEVGVVVLTNATGDAAESELLARGAHAALTDAQPRSAPWWPSADPRVVAGSDPLVSTGLFASGDPGVPPLEVIADPGSGFVEIKQDDVRGSLFRDVRGRYAADHPGLRDFRLVPEPDGSWSYGSQSYGGSATPDAGRSRWTPLVGRYRSFSPWYRSIRLYVRRGRLLLSSPGGVEAPLDEEELVELEPGVFRIGSEEWLPERLQAGPEVDGRCVYVVRDGCHYSRTFLP